MHTHLNTQKKKAFVTWSVHSMSLQFKHAGHWHVFKLFIISAVGRSCDGEIPFISSHDNKPVGKWVGQNELLPPVHDDGGHGWELPFVMGHLAEWLEFLVPLVKVLLEEAESEDDKADDREPKLRHWPQWHLGGNRWGKNLTQERH